MSWKAFSHCCYYYMPAACAHVADILYCMVQSCLWCAAGGIKDLGLMQRLAQESSVPLPLADVIMSHEKEAERQGKGALDWGCIADILREKAGLEKR